MHRIGRKSRRFDNEVLFVISIEQQQHLYFLIINMKIGNVVRNGMMALGFKACCDFSLVVSIEDAFDQDHWDAWTQLTQSVGIQIVG